MIALVTLVVDDYDRAIAFYRDAVGFELVEDTPLGGGKRWVVVRPPRNRGAGLLLAKAADGQQRSRVGDQTGGRVFLFLHTEDFAADHSRMLASGVRFVEPPRHEPYGTVAVFEDLYGNRWDMIERAVTPAAGRAGDRTTLRLTRPALVVIDVQHAIDDPRWGPRNNPAAEDRIADLLAAWRARGLPLFHIRHDSTEPDSTYRPGQPGNEFKPQAAPEPGETVIAKRTNSAFIGTDLADRLRASAADGVVYVGVITNNSVEATVQMSGNLGFDSYVVEDATATVDRTDRQGRVWPAEDVHQLALTNLEGEYATVVTTAEVLAALAG